MSPQIKDWLYGLGAAFIGGGAAAFAGGSAAAIIAPETFNMKDGMGHTMQLTGAIFVLAGLTHVFAYLQRRPLPDLHFIDTQTEKHEVLKVDGKVIDKTTSVQSTSVVSDTAPVAAKEPSDQKPADDTKP